MGTMDHKTALVTGANSGIGKAAAIQLAQLSADVVSLLVTDLSLQNETSGYYDAPHVPVKANKNAYNRETWQRLWHVSAKMTGIQ